MSRTAGKIKKGSAEDGAKHEVSVMRGTAPSEELQGALRAKCGFSARIAEVRPLPPSPPDAAA